MIVVLQTIRQTAAAVYILYPNSLCRYSGLLSRECCSVGQDFRTGLLIVYVEEG